MSTSIRKKSPTEGTGLSLFYRSGKECKHSLPIKRNGKRHFEKCLWSNMGLSQQWDFLVEYNHRQADSLNRRKPGPRKFSWWEWPRKVLSIPMQWFDEQKKRWSRKSGKVSFQMKDGKSMNYLSSCQYC